MIRKYPTEDIYIRRQQRRKKKNKQIPIWLYKWESKLFTSSDLICKYPCAYLALALSLCLPLSHCPNHRTNHERMNKLSSTWERMKKKTLWTTSSLLHIYIPSLEWNQTEKKKPNDSIYKYSIFNHGMCAANAWIVSQLTALAGWFSFIAVFVQDQFYRSSTVSSSSLLTLTNKKKKHTHNSPMTVFSAISLAACAAAAAGPHCKISDNDNDDAINCRFSSKFR